MTRGRGLILAAVASVLLLLAMAPAEERMKDTGGPGMVPFELTGGEDRADEILAEWGEEGQDAARESLWIDFGFLLAYGTFLTLALAATRDLARESGVVKARAGRPGRRLFRRARRRLRCAREHLSPAHPGRRRQSLPPTRHGLRDLQVHPPRGRDRLPARRPCDAPAPRRSQLVLAFIRAFGLQLKAPSNR